jgi:large subunit ribosomal protein L28
MRGSSLQWTVFDSNGFSLVPRLRTGHNVRHADNMTKRCFPLILVNVTLVPKRLSLLCLRMTTYALCSVEHRGYLDAHPAKADGREVSSHAQLLMKPVARKLRAKKIAAQLSSCFAGAWRGSCVVLSLHSRPHLAARLWAGADS